MAFVELTNNGNDLPACTPNLEFSDENRKSLSGGLNRCSFTALKGS